MQISKDSHELLLIVYLILMAHLVSGAGLPPPRGSQQIDVSAERSELQATSNQYHNITYQEHHNQQRGSIGQTSSLELHNGAKIALSITMAFILLVASATFVDLNSSATDGFEKRMGGAHLLQQQHIHHKQQILHKQQQVSQDQQQGSQPQQRDQRSPSLSSSSSSTQFSSANSVSSPILGSRSHHQHKPQQLGSVNLVESSINGLRAWIWLRCGSRLTSGDRSRKSLYSNNLRLQFGAGLPGTAECGDQDESATHERDFDQTVETERHASQKQEQSLAAAVLKAESSWQQQRHLDEDESTSGEQIKPTRSSLVCRQLARQVFLCFSLRHSASLIFASTPASVSDHKIKQQSNISLRRQSRLSSMSSINEVASSQENSSIFQQQNFGGPAHDHTQLRLPETANRPAESIDSLHGLRFLSMIWIIVIHSYSFALRWLFFTSSLTLDSIYKTAATQLLANGTFACDSFFFAGGFLLSYLAFPSAHKQQQQQQPFERRQHSHAATSRSPSLAGASSTAAAVAEIVNRQCKQDNSKSSGSQQVTPTETTRFAGSAAGCLSGSSGSLDSRQSATAAATHSAFHYNLAAEAPRHQHQPIQLDNQTITSTTSCTSTTESCHTSKQQSVPTIIITTTNHHLHTNEFTLTQVVGNVLHRYIRMMPLMMAIIGLSASLLRYMGEGPAWEDSTMMFDKWCRKNWWINALFLHNFVKRENMCLGHSWYSAVDIQLFLIGQLILFTLFRSKRLGLLLCCFFLVAAQLITGALTMIHHLPAVPLIASVSEQTMNLYYGEIYIKPYCRASPYLIGILLAYLMRTTSLGQIRLNKWQVAGGWTVSIGTLVAILMAMQPAMNGQVPGELASALYSSLSRPLWACATGWMIFACMTNHGGIFATILSARCFIPLSRLTYPAFLIHPIVMAVFYGSRQSSFHFSHYLMLYLILGNIVITYAIAFLLSALFELPFLSIERAIKRAWRSDRFRLATSGNQRSQQPSDNKQMGTPIIAAG